MRMDLAPVKKLQQHSPKHTSVSDEGKLLKNLSVTFSWCALLAAGPQGLSRFLSAVSGPAWLKPVWKRSWQKQTYLRAFRRKLSWIFSSFKRTRAHPLKLYRKRDRSLLLFGRPLSFILSSPFPSIKNSNHINDHFLLWNKPKHNKHKSSGEFALPRIRLSLYSKAREGKGPDGPCFRLCGHYSTFL